ncbi:MAG: hypothetical protein HKN03_01355 [Acidimicrobiales bacterium]|nr:hypothetical protein [Acidimicrobiales bacterium]
MVQLSPPAPVVLRAHADQLDAISIGSLDESGVIDLVRANERAIRVLEGVGSRMATRLAELGGLSAEDVFSTAVDGTSAMVGWSGSGAVSTGSARSPEAPVTGFSPESGIFFLRRTLSL